VISTGPALVCQSASNLGPGWYDAGCAYCDCPRLYFL